MAKSGLIQVVPLNAEEQRATGFSHRAKVTFDALTEAAVNTAQTLPLLTVKAGQFVNRAAMVLVTPFKNSADAAFNSNTILVGDGNDTDRFLRSNTAGTGLQVNANGAYVAAHINPVAASANGLDSAPYMYLAEDTVDLVFGSMAAKALNDLDAGELHVFLNVVDLAAQAK